MPRRGAITAILAFFAASLAMPGVARADPAPAATQALMAAALQNILVLDRPGSDGYATIWDGNKYVQCGRPKGGGFRCEAAGAAMQPSLAQVLTPEKLRRLSALGWKLDPSFGNYTRIFPAKAPLTEIAGQIVRLLSDVYAADTAQIDVQTAWVSSGPCPPRNGYGQNLAGMINDAPAMRATALEACAFVPPAIPSAPTSTAQLIALYGPRATAEIQRLRVNLHRRVFVVFDSDIGYIECEPDAAPLVIYCEAQSADTWPALGRILTPDRIARLHAAGYADPGRTSNYSKAYSIDKEGDAAIADEVLTLLHDVYGYDGAEPLTVKTETGVTP
jgi:hypothetical protein